MSNATFPRWEHLFRGGVIGVLSSSGLGLYLLVLNVILFNRQHFSNCFYPYLICLGVFDCIMLCIWLFYSVPCSLHQMHIFGERADVYIGAVSNGTYFGGLCCVLSLSLNRYYGICRQFSYHTIFSSKMVVLNILLIWFIAIVSGVINALPCCYVRYYFELSIWSYDVDLWGFEYYVWWEHVAMGLTALTIIWSYAAIALELRKNNRFLSQNRMIDTERQARNRRTEIRLAGSFFTYGVYVLIESLLFTVFPMVTENRWLLFGGTGISYVLLCAINPFLYLVTNGSLRKRVSAFINGNVSDSVNSRTGRSDKKEAKSSKSRSPPNLQSQKLSLSQPLLPKHVVTWPRLSSSLDQV